MIRIGELERRTGIPSATIRAWERRYGVVKPRRGESGYRLYSPADERRLRSMAALVKEGLAPAEAADRFRGIGRDSGKPDGASGAISLGDSMRAELIESLLRFDNPASEEVLDRAISTLSLDAFVGDLVLPVLRQIGERWSRDEVTIGQEHFASNVLRGRLMGLARGWGGGDGNLALLACLPGEYHDFGLIGFGLALRERGWRITFLGSDTPIESIKTCAEETEPDVIVVFAMNEDLLAAVEPGLAGLAGRSKLLLAGAMADSDLAGRLGADRLPDDPLMAAGSLAA
jgi:DNA-binding transcriptional MerR regulator